MVIIQLTVDQLKGIIENAIGNALKGYPSQPAPATDELLTVEQAAGFLSLGVATIYSLVSKKSIPYMKPNGKRLYFSKQKLSEWVINGRKKANSEFASGTVEVLRKGPKKKGAQS